MATVFKSFLNNDVASTRTLLHEAIPITGSIVSGTYVEDGDSETNIKNFSHGLFQSSYDYPHLSSSANHIFDVTMGYANECPLSNSAGGVQNDKKIQLYNQFAQVLVGHDVSGNVKPFTRDGKARTTTAGSNNLMDSCFFVSFARLLTKDEIKKGSFKLQLLTGAASTTATQIVRDTSGDSVLTLQDHNAANAYKVNSPAGEYGLLYTASGDAGTDDKPLGHIYYQAGIAVITSSVFRANDHMDDPFSGLTILGRGGVAAEGPPVTGGYNNDSGVGSTPAKFGMVPNNTLGEDIIGSVENCFVSGAISASAGGFRNALYNVEFNNTTELNSTIYFCRASHNEFNYSSNPTYVTGSKITVKNSTLDQPVSYITSIGLYSADNELLAVAKLSEPIKKTPENELTFRVRLDY